MLLQEVGHRRAGRRVVTTDATHRCDDRHRRVETWARPVSDHVTTAHHPARGGLHPARAGPHPADRRPPDGDKTRGIRRLCKVTLNRKLTSSQRKHISTVSTRELSQKVANHGRNWQHLFTATIWHLRRICVLYCSCDVITETLTAVVLLARHRRPRRKQWSKAAAAKCPTVRSPRCT